MDPDPVKPDVDPDLKDLYEKAFIRGYYGGK